MDRTHRALCALNRLAFRLTLLAAICAGKFARAQTPLPPLQDYLRPHAADKLRSTEASLYAVPWRANARTISAYDALQGVAASYNGIGTMTLEQHTAIMKQLALAGVKRLRIGFNYPTYITKDWKSPPEQDLAAMRTFFGACKAAGIRPCVGFDHIPPMGKADSDELLHWWHLDWDEKTQSWREMGWNTELMPVGEVGSEKFKAYLDKQYDSLKFVLDAARTAGFTDKQAYDLELGQGLWWGGPARNKPLPSTDLTALRPGGRIYEFEHGMMKKARDDGFIEPTFWMGQTHHMFDEMPDEEVAPEAAGWNFSFWSQGMPARIDEWFEKVADRWPQRAREIDPQGMYDVPQQKGWGGDSPLYPPLSFREGTPPDMILARPEGWIADRSRHESLIDVLMRTKHKVGITSLVPPGKIPDAAPGRQKDLDVKMIGLPRMMAFWLNQGVSFMISQSMLDRASLTGGTEGAQVDAAAFRYQDSPRLVMLRRICDFLGGANARPVAKLRNLSFQFALESDPVLIGPSRKAATTQESAGEPAGPALAASDAVALLPFQVDEQTYVVAAYVVTPNIGQPLTPVKMTLRIDQRIADDVKLQRLTADAPAQAEIVERGDGWTTIALPVCDEVTWIRFAVK
jgi:hypothetical protein